MLLSQISLIQLISRTTSFVNLLTNLEKNRNNSTDIYTFCEKISTEHVDKTNLKLLIFE